MSEIANLPNQRRILSALRRIVHALESYSCRVRDEYDITIPQLMCLSHIVENEPVTASAISCGIHISNSTLVGIIDRLEEKELVSRQRCRQDRRRINITATENGRKMVARAPSPLHDAFAQALQELSENEQNAIAYSLERIVTLMQTPSL